MPDRVPDHVSDHVLVSDFDGTMTANDFYKLAVERLLPQQALAPWTEYRAGRLTHFEALRDIFAQIRAPQGEVEALAAAMAPDPRLGESLRDLRAAGWRIVVASAGSSWYIERVLGPLNLLDAVEVHANPGVYAQATGLALSMPPASPFTCAETGVDKAAIVRFHRQRGALVAFAGDGFADLPAALATPSALRFARADLATALGERGEGFRSFNAWPDVADALLGRGGAA
jgi:2-hydroxy-3-keto-5-methylthiopentenyl-1-phosphate phosphatase